MGTGKAQSWSWERGHTGSSVLRASNGGDFRGVPAEDLSRTFISFSRCVLSELWSLLIGQHQGGGQQPLQLVLRQLWHSFVCFCCFSGPGARTQLRPMCYPYRLMLKGPLPWKGPWNGSCMRPLFSLVPPPRGACCMTSDMPATWKVRGSIPHDQKYASEGKPPWGEVLVSPGFPVARYPGLSALLTFCSWPVVLALLMPNCLPQ